MVKKIADKNGDTYVEVKPWYKRWWVWVIAVVVILGIIGAISGGAFVYNTKSPPSIKAERVHFMRRSKRRLLPVGKTRVDI